MPMPTRLHPRLASVALLYFFSRPLLVPSIGPSPEDLETMTTSICLYLPCPSAAPPQALLLGVPPLLFPSMNRGIRLLIRLLLPWMSIATITGTSLVLSGKALVVAPLATNVSCYTTPSLNSSSRRRSCVLPPTTTCHSTRSTSTAHYACPRALLRLPLTPLAHAPLARASPRMPLRAVSLSVRVNRAFLHPSARRLCIHASQRVQLTAIWLGTAVVLPRSTIVTGKIATATDVQNILASLRSNLTMHLAPQVLAVLQVPWRRPLALRTTHGLFGTRSLPAARPIHPWLLPILPKPGTGDMTPLDLTHVNVRWNEMWSREDSRVRWLIRQRQHLAFRSIQACACRCLRSHHQLSRRAGGSSRSC